MKILKITLECDTLPRPVTFNLPCDEHDKDTPCTLRVVLMMLRAVYDRLSMTPEEFEAAARNAAFEFMVEKGGEKVE